MGQVIVVIKVMPESPEDFESVKAEVEKLNPERLEEEPIAFGLKAVKVTKIIPEVEGEMDKLEQALKSIPKVKDIEVVMVNRAL